MFYSTCRSTWQGGIYDDELCSFLARSRVIVDTAAAAEASERRLMTTDNPRSRTKTAFCGSLFYQHTNKVGARQFDQTVDFGMDCAA